MFASIHKQTFNKVDKVEIKLSHQFGKGHKYPFEVEALKRNVDLLAIAKNLGSKPHRKHRGPEFWEKWNKELNLDIQGLSDSDLIKLIKEYL